MMDDWLQFTSHCYTRIVTDVRLNVDIAVTMHAPNSVPKNIKAHPVWVFNCARCDSHVPELRRTG